MSGRDSPSSPAQVQWLPLLSVKLVYGGWKDPRGPSIKKTKSQQGQGAPVGFGGGSWPVFTLIEIYI